MNTMLDGALTLSATGREGGRAVTFDQGKAGGAEYLSVISLRSPPKRAL
jgi:hypothetical protein